MLLKINEDKTIDLSLVEKFVVESDIKKNDNDEGFVSIGLSFDGVVLARLSLIITDDYGVGVNCDEIDNDFTIDDITTKITSNFERFRSSNSDKVINIKDLLINV